MEYLPLSAIKPYERNARKHADTDVSAIVASIREFGFSDPIGIWGQNNLIVEGHGRLLAAKKLGMESVPCIRLDHLTDEQRRAYALAHNKTAELSGWDFGLLDLELGDIELDMGPFGFEQETDQDYGTEFDLPDGDRAPVQNMTFTFSDDEAEVVNDAIAAMKQSKAFERYENPLNQNSNGRALFLVVSEWQARKT